MSMVRSGKTLRSASAAVLVAMFLLSTAPMPGAADSTQSHWDNQMPVPNRGMEIWVEGTYANTSIRFDSETSERLAGHHEWRRVINATRTLHFDWEHDHGEHDGNHTHGYERDEVFDLGTGLLLGEGYSFRDEYPFLLGGTPLEDVITHRYTSSGMWGSGIVAHDLLPESVLWGRMIWPGEDWDLSISLPYCDSSSGRVETAQEWWGNSTTPMDVVVTVECTVEYYGTVYEIQSRWDLGFPDGVALLATERTRTVEYTYGNQTEAYTHEVPAKILRNGTWPLPFDGASHSRFVAPRDNTLTYSGLDGLFPADPDPHAYFDIRQAGAEAIRLDDEEVRLFFASADDPQLLGTQMYLTDLGQVVWRFVFLDDSGTYLHVYLYGVKVADGPLVVLDRETDRGTLGGSYDLPDVGETAAPGDLARTIDQALATRDLTVEEYGWARDDWQGGAQMWGRYEGFRANPYEETHGRVLSDASTGIVLSHSAWDARMHMSLQDL